jgi:hypothetical protein
MYGLARGAMLRHGRSDNLATIGTSTEARRRGGAAYRSATRDCRQTGRSRTRLVPSARSAQAVRELPATIYLQPKQAGKRAKKNPSRARPEKTLASMKPRRDGRASLWQDLFGARFDVLLYDLTSTYFESDPPADAATSAGMATAAISAMTACKL